MALAADLLTEYRRRPSTVAYMLRAMQPARRRKRSGGFPPVRVTWTDVHIVPRELNEFVHLTGLPANGSIPMLYPHVLGFRLLMAILTHRAFPVPIWGALQIRNHLVQHRSIPTDATLDLDAHVAEHRILEKGAEVDLLTRVRVGGELAWESVNTFYYRGRFGEAASPPSPLARAPQAEVTEQAQWTTLSGVGRRFGALTGDYNGIHLWDWYARLFGFERAFHHPQFVLGQCMARLPACDPERPQRLDAWLKGPVFYASDVVLRTAVDAQGGTFALHSGGDDRPALQGRWSSA